MPDPVKKIAVVHIITGLEDGGAEGALFRLIKNTVEDIDHVVISLTSEGKYGPMLRELDIPLYITNLRSLAMPFGFLKLLHLLSKKKQDSTVIQTWMYHSDLIGGVSAKILGYRMIIWGIRQTSVHLGSSATWAVAKCCALVSKHVPNGIVSCSHAATNYHRKMGYQGKFHTIPNGYSFEHLKPNVQLRQKTRENLNLDNAPLFLIGCVASWKPFKDHRVLLAGLSIWTTNNPDTNFRLLLAGKGCDSNNKDLIRLIEHHHLKNKVTLLGQITDIGAIMNALDLHVLASKTEGFPNVIAEAMACGTPCLTTDVGDASEIVGDTGWIVPPQSPELFAKGLEDATDALLDNNQSVLELSERCRSRVLARYPIQRMADDFRRIWSA